MSAPVATRPGTERPAAAGAVAAVAVVGALAVGVLLAARPAVGAAALGFACYVPLVMSSVAAGVAVWIPVVFVKTIPGLAATCMLLAICAAWAGSVIARRAAIGQLLPGQRFLVGALALLLAWLSLSVLWADQPEMAWGDLRSWFMAAAVLIVVASTIRSPGQLRLVLLAFAFGAVLSVVVGWAGAGPHVEFRPIDPAYVGPNRFSGADGNPNDLAAQLVPAIVLAAALVADRGSPRARWGLIASVVVLTIALAATQSRGGLLSAAVVVLAAAVAYTRRWPYAPLVALALVATVAGSWLALSPHAPGRVFSRDEGGSGRSALWLVAWRITKADPVEGVGLNNFRAVAPGYVRQPGSFDNVQKITDRPHVVHNTYLQLLAETGVVGLALFLAVVGACLAAAWRAAGAFARRGQRDLALLAQAVLLACLGALCAQLFQSAGNELRLWMLLALGPALWTIANRPSTSTRP